jgi:hypothetical protein
MQYSIYILTFEQGIMKSVFKNLRVKKRKEVPIIEQNRLSINFSRLKISFLIKNEVPDDFINLKSIHLLAYGFIVGLFLFENVFFSE